MILLNQSGFYEQLHPPIFFISRNFEVGFLLLDTRDKYFSPNTPLITLPMRTLWHGYGGPKINEYINS